MSSGGIPYQSLVGNLDGASEQTARDTLVKLIKQQNDEHEQSQIVLDIAEAAVRIGRPLVVHRTFELLGPWARHVTQSTDFLVALTQHLEPQAATTFRDDDEVSAYEANRVGAVKLLAANPEGRARDKVFELVADKEPPVREAAMKAVPEITSRSDGTSGATALLVLSNPEDQKLALELLDQLDKDIHKLLDSGDLRDGQVEAIQELILPKISELRNLLTSPIETRAEQAKARTRSFGIGSALVGTAKTFAYGLTGLANADGAYKNVHKLAEAIEPLIDSLPGL